MCEAHDQDYESQFEELMGRIPSGEREDFLRFCRNVIHREMFLLNGHESEVVCPHCGSRECRKFGFDAHQKQRHQCALCGRTFVQRPEGSIMFHTKLPYEKWHMFAECFVDRLSCSRTSQKIEVTKRTAWFMRIRMLEALSRNLPSFEVKADCEAHVDEIYFTESFKGVSLKNLGVMPRDPRRTGGSPKRGISNDKICVVTGINDNRDFLYVVACRGPMTVEVAEKVLEERVLEGAIINTDNHKAYPKALGELRVRLHRSFDDKDHESLKPINDIHSAIRSFMRPFHGVSTKWLGLYMAYFKWVHEFGRSEDKASRQVRLGDYVHRWRDINLMPLPFRDAMMREVKV